MSTLSQCQESDQYTSQGWNRSAQAVLFPPILPVPPSQGLLSPAKAAQDTVISILSRGGTLCVAIHLLLGPRLFPNRSHRASGGADVGFSPGQHSEPPSSVLTAFPLHGLPKASIPSSVSPSCTKFPKRNKKADTESKITQMCMCGLKATNRKRCRFNEAVKK